MRGVQEDRTVMIRPRHGDNHPTTEGKAGTTCLR